MCSSIRPPGKPERSRTSRRPFLLAVASLAVLGPGSLITPARGAIPGQIAFRALRNGNPIGTHTLDFTRGGDQLTVDIEIRFEVKFAFFTLYSYRHTNRETWEQGRLVALETSTDDNGERYHVSGRAVGDAFEVEGSSGRLRLPADVAPSSYWDEELATRGEWLDTQAGKLVRSSVKRQPPERVKVAGRMVEAIRYGLQGDITCDLWYHEGEWVKLLFLGEDGSAIEYVRIARPVRAGGSG